MVGQRRAACHGQTTLVIVSSRRGANIGGAGRAIRRDGCIGIGIGTGTGSPRRPARRSSHSPYDAFAKATDEASTGRAGSRIQSFMLPAYRYSLL